MNAEQLRSLARLLDYVAEDEQKHFEDTPARNATTTFTSTSGSCKTT